MLARHIHQFFTDEGHSSSSVHVVNPSRAPPAGPTDDAQVAPAADEGRGRVGVPEGRSTAPIHHLHHPHPHLRPRLHFYSILPVGQQQQRRHHGNASAGRRRSPWRPPTSEVTWCRVIRHQAGRSYRNNLVNSLMAQHTCLHSSALQGEHTAVTMVTCPAPRPGPLGPRRAASPGDLLVEVGQLFVGHSHGASRRLFG